LHTTRRAPLNYGTASGSDRMLPPSDTSNHSRTEPFAVADGCLHTTRRAPLNYGTASGSDRMLSLTVMLCVLI
ncbi:MAG: hypothetical protein ACREBG_10475, partial [Pyrinomonadaceae bacterium]